MFVLRIGPSAGNPHSAQHLDKNPKTLTYSKPLIQEVGYNLGSILTLRRITRKC